MLEWTIGHCRCIEFVEYILFDYLHVFAVWIKKSYSFFKLLDTRARYRTLATVPPPNTKPSPLPAPSFAVTRSRKERGEGEEEKRREGKLGHIFVDPRRYSSKTMQRGWMQGRGNGVESP